MKRGLGFTGCHCNGINLLPQVIDSVYTINIFNIEFNFQELFTMVRIAYI